MVCFAAYATTATRKDLTDRVLCAAERRALLRRRELLHKCVGSAMRGRIWRSSVCRVGRADGHQGCIRRNCGYWGACCNWYAYCVAGAVLRAPCVAAALGLATYGLDEFLDAAGRAFVACFSCIVARVAAVRARKLRRTPSMEDRRRRSVVQREAISAFKTLEKRLLVRAGAVRVCEWRLNDMRSSSV